MALTQENTLRREILDKTRHLLVEFGYQNLSMRKIAREIGYSATTLYLYFESKDRLVHSLIDEGMGLLFRELEKVVSIESDPVRRLQLLGEAYIRFGLENPEYYEIMFQLRQERMDRYPAEMYRRARRNLDIFIEALTDGVDKKVLAVENAQVSANVVWAALHGAVSLLLAGRLDQRLDKDQFIDVTVRQIASGFFAEILGSDIAPG